MCTSTFLLICRILFLVNAILFQFLETDDLLRILNPLQAASLIASVAPCVFLPHLLALLLLPCVGRFLLLPHLLHSYLFNTDLHISLPPRLEPADSQEVAHLHDTPAPRPLHLLSSSDPRDRMVFLPEPLRPRALGRFAVDGPQSTFEAGAPFQFDATIRNIRVVYPIGGKVDRLSLFFLLIDPHSVAFIWRGLLLFSDLKYHN